MLICVVCTVVSSTGHHLPSSHFGDCSIRGFLGYECQACCVLSINKSVILYSLLYLALLLSFLKIYFVGCYGE